MSWSDIPWDPSARTLRQFAALWLVFLTALACWHGLHGAVVLGPILGVMGGVIGLAGLVYPGTIRPWFVGLLVAAFPLGWAVSRLTLALLFYGVFTPLGLVFRLTGRDALCLRHRPGQTTCWMPRRAEADLGRYFRPF